MGIYALIPSCRAPMDATKLDEAAIRRCVMYAVRGGATGCVIGDDSAGGGAGRLEASELVLAAKQAVEGSKEVRGGDGSGVLLACGEGDVDLLQAASSASMAAISGLLVRIPARAAASPEEVNRFMREISNAVRPLPVVFSDAAAAAPDGSLPAGLHASVLRTVSGSASPSALAAGYRVELGSVALRCSRVRQALTGAGGAGGRTPLLLSNAALVHAPAVLARGDDVSLLVPCALAPLVSYACRRYQGGGGDRAAAVRLLNRIQPMLLLMAQHPATALAVNFRLCRARNLCAEPQPPKPGSRVAEMSPSSGEFERCAAAVSECEAERTAAQSTDDSTKRAYGLIPKPPAAKGGGAGADGPEEAGGEYQSIDVVSLNKQKLEEAGGEYAQIDQVAVTSTKEAGGEYTSIGQAVRKGNPGGGSADGVPRPGHGSPAEKHRANSSPQLRQRNAVGGGFNVAVHGVSKGNRPPSASAMSTASASADDQQLPGVGDPPKPRRKVPTLRLIHLPSALSSSSSSDQKIVSPRAQHSTSPRDSPAVARTTSPRQNGGAASPATLLREEKLSPRRMTAGAPSVIATPSPVISPRGGGRPASGNYIKQKEDEIRRLQQETLKQQTIRSEQLKQKTLLSPRKSGSAAPTCEHCSKSKPSCKVQEEETGRSFLLCMPCAKNLMAQGATVSVDGAAAQSVDPSSPLSPRSCGRCRKNPPVYNATMPSGQTLPLCLDCALARDGPATLTSPRETILQPRSSIALAPLKVNSLLERKNSGRESPRTLRTILTSPRLFRSNSKGALQTPSKDAVNF